MSNHEDEIRAVYVISVAAELAGMHAQTLRLYERRGLVNPARTGGGSRRYSPVDILRLQRIQELTNEGLNLEGVRQVIALERAIEELRQENDELRSRLSGQRSTSPTPNGLPVKQVHIRTWTSSRKSKD